MINVCPYVLNLTYKIASHERLALSTAYSLDRYGKFRSMYDNTHGNAGNTYYQWLSRAYLFFSQCSRSNFYSTIYFFLENVIWNRHKRIFIPIPYLRVVRNVFWGTGRLYTVTFGQSDVVTDDFRYMEAYIGGVPAIGTYFAHMAYPPYQSWYAHPNDELLDPVDKHFLQYPNWRILDEGLFSYYSKQPLDPNRPDLVICMPNIYFSTQVTRVAYLEGNNRFRFDTPIEDFMARALRAKVSNEFWNRTSYLYDYVPYYDMTVTENAFTSFFGWNEELEPFPGDIKKIDGGILLTFHGESSRPTYSSNVVFAVTGEVAFRPSYSLDRAEQFEEGSLNPDSNKDTPYMLYPFPSYDHLEVLNKYHDAIAQSILVTHLTADDSRYQAEMGLLSEMTKTISIDPPAGIDIGRGRDVDIALGKI